MPVPPLEGQPAWVVITVVLLTVAGGLGIAYLTARARSSSSQDKVPASVGTSPESSAMTVIHLAMEHLAETARRESEQSEESQREASRLRDQLREAERRLTQAQRDLEACQDNARKLAARVYGHES